MVLDIHRLFHTVDIIPVIDGKLRLSVDLSGIITLEQIVFNKMMLFSTVYHHHKVRAAECLFKEGIEWPIKSVGQSTTYIRLRDVFPVDDWVKAFSENKWKGYIFSRPEHRTVVYEAGKAVLSEVFNIELNELSKDLCKIYENGNND